MPGPYVITTKPARVHEAERRHLARIAGIKDGSQPATGNSLAAAEHALRKVRAMCSVRTVDTLDEVQDAAAEIIGDLLHAYYATPGRDWTGRKATTAALLDAAYELPESGGKITLPDGTVIEVEPQSDDFDVAAFNAKREVA